MPRKACHRLSEWNGHAVLWALLSVSTMCLKSARHSQQNWYRHCMPSSFSVHQRLSREQPGVRTRRESRWYDEASSRRRASRTRACSRSLADDRSLTRGAARRGPSGEQQGTGKSLTRHVGTAEAGQPNRFVVEAGTAPDVWVTTRGKGV